VVRRFFLSLLLATACHVPSAFHCATSAECAAVGAEPICQPTGFCSAVDDSCASHQRYAIFAGNLSGICVSLPTDASTIGDSALASSDASPVVGSDLMSRADAATSVDLTTNVDLATSVDLATAADLSAASDLSVPRDLSVSPDLRTPPDLSTPPDLLAPADLATPADMAPAIGACDGLLRLYHFDEPANASTFADASSAQANASCTNCPTIVTGKFGNGLSFDGAGNFVSLSETEGLVGNRSTASIAMWVNSSAPTDKEDLYCESDASNGFPSFKLSRAQESPFGGDTSPGDQIAFSQYTAGWNDLVTPPSVIVFDGAWHFIVAAFDGNGRTLYVDGTEVISDMTPGSTTTPVGSTHLGDYFNGGELYTGLMDEVTLWDHALTQTEVTNLFTTGVTPNCP
jgi:hypothetical protein